MGYGPNEIENTDYEVWRKYKNNYAIKCRDMLCSCIIQDSNLITTGEYDPFLLTGFEALAAVQRLTAKGELFFGEIPHDRQLRWLNFLRKCNRLAGHIRASERPGFPYYRI